MDPLQLSGVRGLRDSSAKLGGASGAAVTVREAIHALAAPPVAERILKRALRRANAREVPKGGSRLQRFVESHLDEATAFVFGADAAEALRRQLVPLVSRIPSLVPSPLDSREVDARPTLRPTLVPWEEVVHVLVASLDEDRLRGLRAAFGEQATVQSAEDVVALFDAIQPPVVGDLVIVVDCRDPSVQAETLATIAGDLPQRCLVLLWGARNGVLDETCTLVGDAAQWLACGSDAGPEKIAAMVRMLRQQSS